jgi:undecaprenyl diphosphate synthase
MINTPKHIGIIMDGNRRWARERGLPTFEGHKRGYEKIKEVGDWCFKRGVKILTLFAFSTENWNRKKEEVEYLMNLLHFGLTKELNEFDKRGIRLKIIGRREGLPEKVAKAKDEAEKQTEKNTAGLLQLAINYGGRPEIVDAVKKSIRQGVAEELVDEKLVEENLYTAGVPDPDLIIRTSGEQRLSGFLLWQSAYSELYFCQKYWPDFSEQDLDEALAWFTSRGRRFGK